jgi:hypothetical protein
MVYMVAKAKKIKVSDIQEEPIAYEEVVREVGTPPNEQQQSSSSAGTEPETPAPLPSKEKGMCEACGKTMTMKNLKYSHKFTCSALRKAEPEPEIEEDTEEEIVMEEAPPKPALRRMKSTYEHSPVQPVEEIPLKIPKAKRVSNRVPKQYEFQPTMDVAPVQPKMTKAMLKAEKYHNLVCQALP